MLKQSRAKGFISLTAIILFATASIGLSAVSWFGFGLSPDMSGPYPIGSRLYPYWQQHGTVNFYRLSGPQTLLTPTVKNAASKITSTSNKHAQAQKIMDWLHANINSTTNASETGASCGGAGKRARTADQIITSKCATGCTDWTIAFAALARAKGLSATVTETINDQWITDSVAAGEILNPRQGHFFSEVYTGTAARGGWEITDPTLNNFTTEKNGFMLFRAKFDDAVTTGVGFGSGTYYQLFRRGLDSWDYGLRTDNDFEEAIREQFDI